MVITKSVDAKVWDDWSVGPCLDVIISCVGMAPVFALQQILPPSRLQVLCLADGRYNVAEASSTELLLARANCKPERLFTELDSPTTIEHRHCE